MRNAPTNMDDIIDVRDLIARFEELEDAKSDFEHDEDGNVTEADWAEANPEEATEFEQLQGLLDALKGYGGDEQWRGDWYPITIVRDSHFTDYAQELAEDCCPYPRNSPEAKALEQWPYRCIDWEQATRELKMDYSTVEFDGVTYWYR